MGIIRMYIRRFVDWVRGFFRESRRLDVAPRSGQWPTVRKHFLADHPTCAVCGGDRELQVHHCTPFSVDKSKELDPQNLIVLCEKNNCHLLFGHLGSFRSYNVHVREDAAEWRKKIESRP